MGKGKIILYTIYLCLGLLEVTAQNLKRLGVEASYGYIIAHSSDLRDISKTKPRGFSGSFQWMKTDHESWKACNCFYYYGLRFSYHDFNNRDILGGAYSLTGTFEPLIWHKLNWAFSINSGIGLSYLTRVFDVENNPSNIFFGVPWNFLLYIAPTLAYRFTPRWALQAFVTYNHISNGGRKQPNKGMNFPMAGIGLSHYISSAALPSYSKVSFIKRWQYYAEAAFSHKEAEWAKGRKPVMALTLGAYKTISAINALGGGLELNQDYSLVVENSRWESFMPAPFMAHHFLFGRIDFSQRIAIYSRKPNLYNDNLLYQRYILTYPAWRNWSLGVGLKAHGHVAENIEFRLGWRF